MDEAELRRALEESERRYREVFDTNTAVKLVIDPDGGAIVDANPAACSFYGYPRDILVSMRIDEINTMPPERVKEEMERARSERRLYFRFQHRVAGGAVRDVDVYTGPITSGGKKLLYSIVIDQTERRDLERQLLRAQRMEIMGKLAGGVAHDFNNLLAIVLTSADMGRRSVREGDVARERFDEIIAVALRAADVTRQLLTLAKKQVVQPRPVRVESVVVRIDQLLRRLLGEDIELVNFLPDNGWSVVIDPGQLEQVLVNLAVNARDAMPRGGTLRIEVAHLTLEPRAASERGVGAGRWVELSVSDTGIGMPPEIQARVFEPFFTTKDRQGGTGLGLATCQTIIENAGGTISLRSAPGAGSRFAVLLPASSASAIEPGMPARRSEAPAGTETILVVEDEPGLRRLFAESLASFGYAVLTAGDGASALTKVAEDGRKVDLVLTDVVMPLMSGIDLVRRIRESTPAMPVLFVTGYSAGLLGEKELDDATRLLSKPFSAGELARAVRDLLDRAAR